MTTIRSDYTKEINRACTSTSDIETKNNNNKNNNKNIKNHKDIYLRIQQAFFPPTFIFVYRSASYIRQANFAMTTPPPNNPPIHYRENNSHCARSEHFVEYLLANSPHVLSFYCPHRLRIPASERD